MLSRTEINESADTPGPNPDPDDPHISGKGTVAQLNLFKFKKKPSPHKEDMIPISRPLTLLKSTAR